MTGNPVLNTLTDPTVTSSPLLVTNTTAGTTTTIDMINPATTFTCNPGDAGTCTPLGDVNPAGSGPAGIAFAWTAPTEPPPPPPLPGMRTVSGVNFTP